jgi:hypothetical protein
MGVAWCRRIRLPPAAMHRIIAQAAYGRANDRARVLPDADFMLIDARALRNASRAARARFLLSCLRCRARLRGRTTDRGRTAGPALKRVLTLFFIDPVIHF